MIDAAPFYAGLAVIGLQLNQPVGKDAQKAYFLAMADETTCEEWEAFVAVAAKRFGWRFLPSVPALLDALREFRGLPSLDAEATLAYESVMKAGIYTPEGGTTWTYRGVREACGDAAAEAFLAAGGSDAFARTWDEAKRQQRFLAAYVAAAREEPAGRLPSVGSQPALPEARPRPSASEAAEMLREIQRRAAVSRVDMERAGEVK